MTVDEILQLYQDALSAAKDNQNAFFKKYNDVMSGKIRPPQYYIDNGTVDVWQKGFLREAMRQSALVQTIQADLQRAGGVVQESLQHQRRDAFIAAYGNIAKDIEKQCSGLNLKVNLAQYSKDQVDALIDDNSPIFTRIAFNNIGRNAAAVRRLKNSLATSIMLGESQSSLVKRIQKDVAGYAAWQAWRTAQTQRQRVQNFAQNNVGEQCRKQGIVIEWQWVCHFLPAIPGRRGTGSRESHIQLNGQKRLQSDTWKTMNGAQLRYPGDPTAPAKQVINCHCSRVQHVLTPDQARARGIDPNAYAAGIKQNIPYTPAQPTPMHVPQPVHPAPYSPSTPTPSTPAPSAPASASGSGSTSGSDYTTDYSDDIKNSNSGTIQDLASRGIQYLQAAKRSTPLQDDEIIALISGGDNTRGSCASVGLAYAAQRGGLDVRDFRDGKSLQFFSSKANKRYMFQQIVGADKLISQTGGNYVDTAAKVLKQAQQGHVYYMSTGRHAACVRINGGKYQYLELQHPIEDKNGWTDFDDKIVGTFRDRFGCVKSRTYQGVTSYMVDVDDFNGNDTFKNVCGFINTKPSDEKKGSYGQIR